ncbi:MAG: DUF3726 domain-containing protein [Granulosicoccus sp.]|nr:DUF3726 domain-containing protein [Granulosicoccus sp.]
MLDLALNEVDALAKKAARGAGYHWGMATEAGKSTRFLCQYGIDGCQALSRCLNQLDQEPASNVSPQLDTETWCARGKFMCPIAAGTALSDFVDQLSSSGLNMRRIVEPGLLIYHVVECAKRRESVVSLSWGRIRIVVDRFDLCTDNCHETSEAFEDFFGIHDVQLAFEGQLRTRRARQTRASPQLESWDCLNLYASRTYAPATDESRQKGAGADQSDSD